MQSVTDSFNNRARGYMRKLAWSVSIAFLKTFNESVGFFTLNSSLLDGGDLLKPAGGDVVQEWDKYNFVDYTSRLIDVSWESQFEDISSANSAIADIVLDNSDDYFTPGAGSMIDGYILPSRPIRIQAGFGSEVIPQMVGITERMPIIDKKNKTATFHCIDFMSVLFNREIGETSIYQNVTIDTVLADLFAQVGVLPSQLELDTGLTTLPFVYFARGTKLRTAVLKLVQIEQGKVFMDELGKIRFRNKNNVPTVPCWSFDYDRDIIDVETRKEDQLINSVTIRGKAREVQSSAEYWNSVESYEIGPSESIIIWANFDDPVTGVTTPTYEAGANSSFSVNTQSDGGGSPEASDVTLTDFDLFSKAYRMEFTNSDVSNTYYITAISLYATVAQVVANIDIIEQDDSSIESFGEKSLEIVNDFFQSEALAQTAAQDILTGYSGYDDIYEMSVKGNMALQLDDVVSVNLKTSYNNFRITRIVNKISNPAKFTQIIKLRSL